MSISLTNNAIIIGAVLALLALFLLVKFILRHRHPPIKVGIMFSYTGTMAAGGTTLRDAVLMAINEINENGGLLGRKLQPILRDGGSYWVRYQKMAKKIITQDKVSVVFGCWTSVSRKSIKPIFEKYNHLLIYPIQYEGLEESPNIIYNGAAPNQQIIPTIKWAFDNIGQRFFLVGSDYIYPHAANAMIKDQVKALGGEIVGEEYLLLNIPQISENATTDLRRIVSNIIEAKPAVIINTVNSGDNLPFFNMLRAMGVTSDKIPTINFTFGENLLQLLDPTKLAGDYIASNYFQNLPNEVNQRFIKNYKSAYGEHRVTDSAIEAAYFGVHLWAQAVKKAKTDNVIKVRAAMKGQTYIAPEGTVSIDHHNQHTWKIVRIGKIRADGQIDIIWTSVDPVQPLPYPVYRTKAQWEEFLNNLYKKWDNTWKNNDKY